MDSFACGSRGKTFFDKRLIPLDFENFQSSERGHEIAKVGSMCEIETSQQLVKVNLLLSRGRYGHSHDCG